MRYSSSVFALFSSAILISGCAVGYNSTLFMTKSNIGIDAETKPPTVEISIARREGVIAPGFEGGQTPPVLSSFRSKANVFSRFFFGVQSTFAGGEAAVALSEKGTNPNDSLVCLSKEPEERKILFGLFDVSIPKKGEVEPFFFGTDTTFGLKIAWSGTTGQFPDTLRLGFNRKEFAWAPIFLTDQATCTIPGRTQSANNIAVGMPAFLAVLDNEVEVSPPDKTETTWLQYFATGVSASNLANQDEVRQVMGKRLDPVVASKLESTFLKDQAGDILRRFWKPDGKTIDVENQNKLKDWMSANGVDPGSITFFLRSQMFADARVKAVQDLGLQ